ncbi:type II toxin-antitoxin system Phd/YefM family antitoxin [Aliiroseovarius sp. KMU-50]|uniref:Antitoxin n=1 Tax=Aliiroseovarius salicola TaxID=3009082 RepID=A0ABT4VW64_9RHOB|nr:type II toxin-antitoxin system Phd/YefM family antitoxin [Aliiroseovarius sp. KMU-50]MDA5092487.1 type II toxin-antitoxin system Phd/YefM family antitoxin [Aliiroseovarius sp. KMU-50]
MSTILPPLYIRLTDVRLNLTEMIRRTLKGEERMIITRHGKPIVALVTINELHRIWADEDYELFGPVNPETGKRYGRDWVARTGWKRPLSEQEVQAKEDAREKEWARLEEKINSWGPEDLDPELAEAAAKRKRKEKARADAEEREGDGEPVGRKRWWRWW